MLVVWGVLDCNVDLVDEVNVYVYVFGNWFDWCVVVVLGVMYVLLCGCWFDY